MIAPWLGIALVVSLMTGMFCALKLSERLFQPHPELTRKLMHVGTGLIVLSLPWIFERNWPIVLMAGGSAVVLAAIKLIPRLRDGIGTVLTAVKRPSLGEVCFPIAVAILIMLSNGHKLFYTLPILIMTLADAVAALVGITYGKVRYVTSDGFKSAEGSIAFLSIAFLSVHVPLLLFTDMGRPQTLLISALIAVLSMLIEAISARGLDNLLIPLGAFAFLRLYEHATVHALVIRLAAATVLVIFALSWRRRSTLDDSALIACALFGYGAAMLGGAQWLIGPAILFLLHSVVWPRFGKRRPHTVYAVVSVTLAGLFWLILQATYGGINRFYFPYTVGFGAHLAIIGVSRIVMHHRHGTRWKQLAASILAGWIMIAIQLSPLLMKSSSASEMALLAVIGLSGIALAAIGFYELLPFLYGPKGTDAAIHAAGFTVALLGSIIAGGQLMLVR